jgi:hypothetical protein
MPGYHRLRLPEDYQALVDLSASGFAWEWLRRNPDFRAIWTSAGAAAHRAAALALTASRRTSRSIIDLPRHPIARRTAPWGLTFLAVA